MLAIATQRARMGRDLLDRGLPGVVRAGDVPDGVLADEEAGEHGTLGEGTLP